MAKSWAEVSANPEFQALPPDQQEVARVQYFDQVVAPQLSVGEFSDAREQFDAQTAIQSKGGLGDRLLNVGKELAGAGEAGLSAISSIPATLAGNIYGIGKTLTSGQYGTQAGIDIGEKAAEKLSDQLTYSPRTEAGKRDIESVGRALTASKLEGLPPDAALLPHIPETLKGGVRTGEEIAGIANKAGSIASKVTGKAGTAAAGKVAQALPAIDANTAQVAREGQALGFKFRPDQLYENKFGRIAGKLMSDIPFSGEISSQNQVIFNRQVLKAIGGEGDKLTRARYSQAMKRSGRTIDETMSSHDVPVDNQLVKNLTNQVNEAHSYQTSDVERVVNSYVNEIIDKSETHGNNVILPGKALRPILTKLKGQIRTASNGDLRHALTDLQEVIQDAFTPQLTGRELEDWQQARRFYRNGKVIEPLVAKSPGGDISPAAMMGAVTSNQAGKRAMAMGRGGELGKLADIGSMFLREPGTSNTTERAIVASLLAGGGALGGLGVAVPPYLIANIYNRVGPAIAKALVKKNGKP